LPRAVAPRQGDARDRRAPRADPRHPPRRARPDARGRGRRGAVGGGGGGGLAHARGARRGGGSRDGAGASRRGARGGALPRGAASALAAVLEGGGAGGAGEEESTPDALAPALGGSSDAAEVALDEAEGEGEREREWGATEAARPGAAARGRRAPPPLLPPPSPATEALLRQLLAAGFIERIARRAPPDVLPQLCAASRLNPKAWTPYLPASAALAETLRGGAPPTVGPDGLIATAADLDAAARPERVAGAGAGAGAAGGSSSGSSAVALFLHPISSVYDADPTLAPPFVVFSEVTFGKRGAAFMRGVSILEEAWIPAIAAGTPALALGPPLPTPAPRYDAPRDAVLCTRVPIFGDAAWRLAPIASPLPLDSRESVESAARVFGAALLSGTALPALLPYAGALAAPVSLLLKRAPQRRVAELLDALVEPRVGAGGGGGGGGARGSRAGGGAGAPRGPITSLAALLDVWRAAPGFLLSEYSSWLQEDAREKVVREWPRIVRAALAGGGARA
jgi:hypothetical protein